MAYDIVYNTTKYSDFYTPVDKDIFESYIAAQLPKVEAFLDRDEVKDILLKIYSNPVLAKESL